MLCASSWFSGPSVECQLSKAMWKPSRVGLRPAAIPATKCLRRLAGLLGRDHDRRAVGVVGADEVHLVPLQALEPHPGVGLDIFHDVADVERAVGVGQGGGDEELARHALDSRARVAAGPRVADAGRRPPAGLAKDTMKTATVDMLCWPAAACAQTGEADLRRCRGIADAALRLACYDALPLAPPVAAAASGRRSPGACGRHGRAFGGPGTAPARHPPPPRRPSACGAAARACRRSEPHPRALRRLVAQRAHPAGQRAGVAGHRRRLAPSTPTCRTSR